MEKKIKENIGEIIDKLQIYVENAENFAADQAPQLLQEIIYWGIIENSIDAFIGLIVLSICSYAVYYFFTKYPTADDEEQEVAYVFGIIVSSTASIISFCVTLAQLQMVLYIYFAPRLYLIDRISDIARKFS